MACRLVGDMAYATDPWSPPVRLAVSSVELAFPETHRHFKPLLNHEPSEVCTVCQLPDLLPVYHDLSANLDNAIDSIQR